MKRILLMIVALFGLLILTLVIFGMPVQESLSRMVSGAFGGEIGWSRTLVKMTPLLLAGLGMVVAWRAGMYNIGGEGQYIMGGLAGATMAKFMPNVPSQIALTLILLCTVFGGAAWAWISAWLQVKRGVQVVISTILLNFVALQILSGMVQGPLKATGAAALPQTELLPKQWMLAPFSNRTDLHPGVFIAGFTAIVVAIYLKRTVGGFKLRMVGVNPRVMRVEKLAPETVQMKAMALSGGLCGLAGGIEYMALSGTIDTGFPQQWGFLAIPVALLGFLDPIGVVLSAFYFGALFAGTQQMARFGQGSQTMIYVIQGVAVLGFVVITELQKRREKAEVTADV